MIDIKNSCFLLITVLFLSACWGPGPVRKSVSFDELMKQEAPTVAIVEPNVLFYETQHSRKNLRLTKHETQIIDEYKHKIYNILYANYYKIEPLNWEELYTNNILLSYMVTNLYSQIDDLISTYYQSGSGYLTGHYGYPEFLSSKVNNSASKVAEILNVDWLILMSHEMTIKSFAHIEEIYQKYTHRAYLVFINAETGELVWMNGRFKSANVDAATIQEMLFEEFPHNMGWKNYL